MNAKPVHTTKHALKPQHKTGFPAAKESMVKGCVFPESSKTAQASPRNGISGVPEFERLATKIQESAVISAKMREMLRVAKNAHSNGSGQHSPAKVLGEQLGQRIKDLAEEFQTLAQEVAEIQQPHPLEEALEELAPVAETEPAPEIVDAELGTEALEDESPAETKNIELPSSATLEVELEGIFGAVCKQCKRKFRDPGHDEIVKECPHCGYRFYANLTYELRSVEEREIRWDRRRRKRSFLRRMKQQEKPRLQDKLDEIHQIRLATHRPGKGPEAPAETRGTEEPKRTSLLQKALEFIQRLIPFRRVSEEAV